MAIWRAWALGAERHAGFLQENGGYPAVGAPPKRGRPLPRAQHALAARTVRIPIIGLEQWRRRLPRPGALLMQAEDLEGALRLTHGDTAAIGRHSYRAGILVPGVDK